MGGRRRCGASGGQFRGWRVVPRQRKKATTASGPRSASGVACSPAGKGVLAALRGS
ncbi:hypothetical protein CAAN3_05S00364 [[Candida] anglica]